MGWAEVKTLENLLDFCNVVFLIGGGVEPSARFLSAIFSHCTSSPSFAVDPAHSRSAYQLHLLAFCLPLHGSCEGKSFYTYASFIGPAELASGFGTTGSDVVRRREVAAFLANVMHETGGLCYIRERNPQSDYCDRSYTQWPCAAGKRYFGRGPLQLTGNYNYGAAGRAIRFDGLNNPEIVAQKPTISFRTAFWFWMNNDCHNAIVSGRGFGATIRAINSGECKGGNTGQVNSRISYYQRFCRDFGVHPGANLSC
ncbi:hypothetical protein AAC387_Pa02g4458 [Persea americana]